MRCSRLDRSGMDSCGVLGPLADKQTLPGPEIAAVQRGDKIVSPSLPALITAQQLFTFG